MSADNEFHPVTLAADTTDLQAGPISRIGDALTRGVPAAAISGGLSIWNTIVDYGGGDKVDIANKITEMDSNWGDYYKEHTEAVDLAGFVAGSFIPGGIAVKGMKLARAGEGVGATARYLNMTSSRKNYWLQEALKETAESGGTIRSILSANRAKHLAWEAADQAMIGAAAEIAITATMHDAPIFDNATLGDFAWNMTLGAGVSGIVGGALGSIGAKGILKQAQTQIEFKKRAVDTVFDPDFMSKTTGTGTLLFAENIAKLSDETLDLKFSYRYEGASKSVVLDTSGMLGDTRVRAVKTAEDKLALKFNELAGGDESIGQAFGAFVREATKASKAAGKDVDETIGLLNGYLNNVTKISHVDVERMAADAKKFYVSLEPTGLDDMFSRRRVPGKTGKSAYVLTDGVTANDLKVMDFIDTGAKSLKDAWRAGIDADVIMMPGGRAAINPASKTITRIAENPNKIRMFTDLATGTTADEAVVHFADTVQKGKLVIGPASISIGAKNFPQAATAAVDFATSAIQGSARFAWASKLDAPALMAITKGTVNSKDLALMSRLAELATAGGTSTVSKFKVIDGTQEILIGSGEIIDLAAFVTSKKVEVLAEQLGKGAPYDLRHMAAHLNASPDFIEDAITRNFTPPRPGANALPDFPTNDALRPKTVVVEWDFSSTAKQLDPIEAYKQQFGPAFLATAELSRFYKLQTGQMIQESAFNAVMGADAARFMPIGSKSSKEATQAGAGAGLGTSSNANYGDAARLGVQESGKNVQLVSQKLRDEAVLALTPHVNRLRESPAAAAELGILTNALRKSEFRYVFDVGTASAPNRLVSTDVAKLMAKENVDVDTAVTMLTVATGKPRVPHTLDIEQPAVADFLRAHTKINSGRQDKMTTLYNAVGLTSGPRHPDVVYIPPVNTAKYPYHAFVRTKEQIGVASETTMITAKNADELRTLVSKVDSQKYDVHYKKDSEMYFKAKGEYDYDRAMNESRINSDMTRSGALTDFFPETKLENIMEDYLQFHSRQSEKLVRTAVQVKDRQFFSEMQFLSDNYRVVDESVTRGIGSVFKSKVADPFADYTKTALNISKQQEFPLLDSLNEFVDKLGVAAGDAFASARSSAQKGLVSWEEADKIAARFGLGTPYGSSSDAVTAYIAANSSFPKNLIRESFQKANMMLANFTLRLDFANSLINIISTPIMIGTEMQSIKRLVASDPALAGKLAELQSIRVPGQDFSTPSTTKLIGNAISNFFGADKAARLTRYREVGAIKNVSALYHEMLDDLSFNSTFSPNTWYNKVNGAVDKMSDYTGNNWSEEFTRFISADVMRQLSDPIVAAGKLTVKEQNAYISTFVNRVQGNYVTSQRPIVFQGTTGAAVSLFQTYAFNVLQQLHRHVEAGDKKTLAVFAGLQSSVFGFNGLPFFDAVNTHLIGSMVAGNNKHDDAYNMLPAFNKELGDWMLYGTASAFPLFAGATPALYTRGDINPRHITVLPTNIVDVPAVSAGIRLATTVRDFGKNIASGVDLSSAMLQGLEHQGVNRPLAGFAQLLAGRSTTSKGTLISAANELQATSWLGSLAERTVDYGGVGRLMGARPMDEAVALNAIYRNKTYEVLDKTRLANLGRVVKASLYNGEAPDAEELEGFMKRYAETGGRVENFNQAMSRWMKDANVSVVNQTAQKLGSPMARKLRQIMGDEGQIPDYQNGAAPGVAQTPVEE